MLLNKSIDDFFKEKNYLDSKPCVVSYKGFADFRKFYVLKREKCVVNEMGYFFKDKKDNEYHMKFYEFEFVE